MDVHHEVEPRLFVEGQHRNKPHSQPQGLPPLGSKYESLKKQIINSIHEALSTLDDLENINS